MSIDQREIGQAFEKGEFRPHFQPLVDLRTGGLRGFELLARWDHPDRGWVAPDEFIPLAERDGWIDRLMRQLFRGAFTMMASLPDAGTLSVNISPVQLRGHGLPSEIQTLVADSGFCQRRLTIEITESALTEDLAHARTILAELKAIAPHFASLSAPIELSVGRGDKAEIPVTVIAAHDLVSPYPVPGWAR